ncbi:hypothetical protein FRC02_010404 [Tulasnella sp. 418]|nr:hypothetical protein FRC02_010404 [Tulasnella sp. 418]
MKELKEDAAEITNDLLRTIAQRLQDSGSSLETNSSEVFVATPRSIRVNSFFFASLCCSLFTAFGSVLGKQWLNHYTREGPPRSLAERSRDRQMKFMGFERWHMEGILQTLPTLLQFSLFFFLIGLVDWVWDINLVVAGVITGFSAFTLTFYITTTTISLVDSSSPFQTRFTRHLHDLLVPFRQHLVSYIRRVRNAVNQHGRHALWSWPFILVGAITLSSSEFPETGYIPPPLMLTQWIMQQPWLSATVSMFATIGQGLTRSRRLAPLCLQDDDGGHCVRWLLQQYPNSDHTVNAIFEATMALEETALEQDELLDNLVMFLLKPSQSNMLFNVSSDRIRANLAPLSRLVQLSKKKDVFLGEAFVRGNLRRPWGELCHTLWKVLAENPHDPQSMSYAARIMTSLGYKRAPDWPFIITHADVLLSQQWLSSHIVDLPAIDPLSPSYLSATQLDYMTLFACAFVSRFARRQALQLEQLKFLSSDQFTRAFVTSLLADGRPDAELWRGRLRLLCLREMPETYYPLLPTVAGRFSRFLAAWIAAEEEEGGNPYYLRAGMLPIQLYCDTIRLLLVQDHKLWYDELHQGGHFDLLQKFMTSTLAPTNHPDDATLKFVPFHCFIVVFSRYFEDDPERAKRLYLDQKWASSVRDCIHHLIEADSSGGITQWFRRFYRDDTLEDLAIWCTIYTQLAYDAGFLTRTDVDEIGRFKFVSSRRT